MSTRNTAGAASSPAAERVVYRADRNYRSIRRSSSAVLGNIKKKLSTAQEAVRSRRALQPLNEASDSPAVRHTPRRRLAAYRNPAATVYTPLTVSAKKPARARSSAAKVEGLKQASAADQTEATLVGRLRARAAKALARRRIGQLQTPKSRAKRAGKPSAGSAMDTPSGLTREVNELLRGFRMLDEVAQRQAARHAGACVA